MSTSIGSLPIPTQIPGKRCSRFPKSLRGSSKIKNFSTRFSLNSENGGLKASRSTVGGEDGIIIVDHGSRRKESNLMLNEFVAMFRDKTGYPIVEPAHMELAKPSIRDAFSLCVQQGAKRVIVSPFFLFPGRHWHQDIPSLTAEAAKDHDGISYIITAPLGLHHLLVDVVNDRINYCLNHIAGEATECAACPIGEGLGSHEDISMPLPTSAKYATPFLRQRLH